MKSNRETMTDVKIVEKILRTLTEKYMFVVSTLIVHEQKFKKNEKEEEHTLKADIGDNFGSRGRGRGRSNYKGRGCGRGHYSYECPNAKEANYIGFDENEEIMLMTDGGEEGNVFMAHSIGENKGKFIELDESFSNTVKLGNNTPMNVEGKENLKLILNGVPDLKNNLLSVSTNQMYPRSEDTNSDTEQKANGCLYSSDDDVAKLWHERLRHISTTSLKTLQHKGMVRDLPDFTIDTSVCGDCMVESKQGKRY
ncbi:hypothetical protein LXL04_035326 [Taraxacum kok-saghyz]